GLAVLHLVLLDRPLPFVQVRFGEKVLVVLGDKPSCFLVSVNYGWVDSGSLHGLDGHVLDLLWMGHVKEHFVSWTRFSPVLLNELLTLFFKEAHHLVGHGDRLEDRAVVVLFVVEALPVAAVLVLLAATARTWGVARKSFTRHFGTPFNPASLR